MRIRDIVVLTRPQQWFKNIFVFLPLFFSAQFLNIELLKNVIVAFFAFSFIASSIYCFNDIYDAEYDKLHPKKKNRPIASGRVKKQIAYLIMLVLFVFAQLVVFSFFGFKFTWLAGIINLYFILNIAYTIYLKHIAIIDVFIIAVGFVLRLLIGGVASGIVLSHWIVIMTFLLALFLGFSKRKDDIVVFENEGVKARGNIGRYNSVFLNQTITIIATITMISYIMYTVSEDVIERTGSEYMYLNAVFVLLGILRYLQLTLVDKNTGNPTDVLIRDRFIQISIVCWVVSFILILYV